jgi:hypothetical protein
MFVVLFVTRYAIEWHGWSRSHAVYVMCFRVLGHLRCSYQQSANWMIGHESGTKSAYKNRSCLVTCFLLSKRNSAMSSPKGKAWKPQVASSLHPDSFFSIAKCYCTNECLRHSRFVQINLRSDYTSREDREAGKKYKLPSRFCLFFPFLDRVTSPFSSKPEQKVAWVLLSLETIARSLYELLKILLGVQRIITYMAMFLAVLPMWRCF